MLIDFHTVGERKIQEIFERKKLELTELKKQHERLKNNQTPDISMENRKKGETRGTFFFCKRKQ